MVFEDQLVLANKSMKVQEERYHLDISPSACSDDDPVLSEEEEQFGDGEALIPGLSTKILKKVILALMLLGLVGFSIAAFVIDFNRALPLFVIEMIVLVYYILNFLCHYYEASITAFSNSLNRSVNQRMQNREIKVARIGTLFATFLIVITSVILNWGEWEKLTPLGGIFCILLSCYILSWKRKDVELQPIIGGILLQYLFGLLALRTYVGNQVFQWLAENFVAFINYTYFGARFVFGYLVDTVTIPGDVKFTLNPVFAFYVLSIVVFFSAIVSILFYLNAIQNTVYCIGRFMMFALGTSGPETVATVSNIFLGSSESPLLIRPYLPHLTHSELHCVLTAGFGSVAGSTLGAYMSFGISAEHLIAACFMNAPAALAISKLVYPETRKAQRMPLEDLLFKDESVNIVEAAAKGASTSISLVANIAANLLVFISLIALLNSATSFLFGLINVELNFTQMLGYFFYPVALLLGVSADDSFKVGQLIGTKITVNEFVAFMDLGAMKNDINPRSYTIATYALCGFSNFSSIGINLGAIGAMAPTKKKALAKLVFSAMIAGNCACFLTACVAALVI